MKPEIKTISNHDDIVHVRLSGSLTVRFHAELHKAFSEMLRYNQLHLEINLPDAVDLWFMQIFYAFKKQIHSAGRKLTITTNLAEPDIQVLKNTGLLELLTTNKSTAN